MPRSAPSPSPGSGVSIAAVLGALILVVGSVGLGVFGPRMGQRGTRVPGESLSVLRDGVFQALRETPSANETDADVDPRTVAGAMIENVFGPGIVVPALEGQGLRLDEATVVELAGRRAVRLRYQDVDDGHRVVVFLVSDPHDFLHFDALGRHLPLMPGVRVEEEFPGRRGQADILLAMVVQAQEGHAVVVVARTLEEAIKVEEAILPPEPEIVADSIIVAAILNAGRIPGPM